MGRAPRTPDARTAWFGSRTTWLGRLWSVGRRFARWLDRAPRDIGTGTDVPVFAPELATPARAARRTVIVSGEHYPGEPFAVTRRFTRALEHELELSIELEPDVSRARPRGRRHGRKGAKRWTR